jgi:hypothetical protein
VSLVPSHWESFYISICGCSAFCSVGSAFSWFQITFNSTKMLPSFHPNNTWCIHFLFTSSCFLLLTLCSCFIEVQAIYYLSLSLTPFFFSFSDRVLGSTSDSDPPPYASHHSWNYTHMTSWPTCWWRWICPPEFWLCINTSGPSFYLVKSGIGLGDGGSCL